MGEKNYSPSLKEKKITTKKEKKVDSPIKIEEKKQEQVVEPSAQENKALTEKIEEKKEEKKEIKKPEIKKKEEAIARGTSLPISTKDAAAICNLIRKKSLDKAIEDLEEVARLKKPVPMKGEFPHQKGKGISGASYPKKAAENILQVLKTLKTNASVNGLEEPIIFEAVANIASKPYGRFGRIRRKRTHLKLVAKEAKKREGKEI